MKLQLLFVTILALFAINQVNVVAQVASTASREQAAKAVYTCPMHPEVKSNPCVVVGAALRGRPIREAQRISDVLNSRS